jgi:hypothetical protein
MKNQEWKEGVGIGIMMLFGAQILLIILVVYLTYFTDQMQLFRLGFKPALIFLVFEFLGIEIGRRVYKYKMGVDFGLALSILNFSIIIFIAYLFSGAT